MTALPPPNDYQASCFSEAPPCALDPAGELRLAADMASGEAGGNLLFPVGWQGVLVPSSVPVPRLVHARVKSPLPFAVPDGVFVGSFTPEGGKLPPIFEPQIAGDPGAVTLFGSTDAPYTILRFARRHGTCADGTNAGQRCETVADCPGGTACERSCVRASSASSREVFVRDALQNRPRASPETFPTAPPLTLNQYPRGSSNVAWDEGWWWRCQRSSGGISRGS